MALALSVLAGLLIVNPAQTLFGVPFVVLEFVVVATLGVGAVIALVILGHRRRRWSAGVAASGFTDDQQER